MSYRYSSQHNRSNKNIFIIIGAIALAGVALGIYGLLSLPSDKIDEESQMVLTKAIELSEDEMYSESLTKFDEFLALSEDHELDENASFMRLKALDQTKNYAELAAASQDFIDKFPESEHLSNAEVLRLTSEIQVSGLTQPGLIKSVEDFLRENPDHKKADQLELALARHEIKIGDYEIARRRLGELATNPEVQGNIAQVARREMGDLNLDALLSGSPHDQTYTVQSGDSIWKIANNFDVSQELLMMVNRITDPSRLRVGETLRVPNTDFALVCDVSKNELILFNHGEFLKSYTVRTGRVEGTTPEGQYKVLNKKTNPTWRPGNGDVYLPGDPNNELGTRWMAFEGDILGIHGTIHPETLGAYASNGCIGMSQRDVEELFDLILVGTPLTITGEQDTDYAPIIPAPEVPAPMSQTEIARLNP